MNLRLDGLEAHGDCFNRFGANMVICLSILARVKSGSRYPFHVSCDLERRAVFAREEGIRKG